MIAAAVIATVSSSEINEHDPPSAAINTNGLIRPKRFLLIPIGLAVLGLAGTAVAGTAAAGTLGYHHLSIIPCLPFPYFVINGLK